MNILGCIHSNSTRHTERYTFLGSKLVGKRDGQLGVLVSVLPAEAVVGDSVAGSVGGRVLIGKGALERKSGGVALAVPAGVVRASISTLLVTLLVMTQRFPL